MLILMIIMIMIKICLLFKKNCCAFQDTQGREKNIKMQISFKMQKTKQKHTTWKDTANKNISKAVHERISSLEFKDDVLSAKWWFWWIVLEFRNHNSQGRCPKLSAVEQQARWNSSTGAKWAHFQVKRCYRHALRPQSKTKWHIKHIFPAL